MGQQNPNFIDTQAQRWAMTINEVKVHQMTPRLNHTPYIDKQIVEHVVASTTIDIMFGTNTSTKVGCSSLI